MANGALHYEKNVWLQDDDNIVYWYGNLKYVNIERI